MIVVKEGSILFERWIEKVILSMPLFYATTLPLSMISVKFVIMCTINSFVNLTCLTHCWPGGFGVLLRFNFSFVLNFVVSISLLENLSFLYQLVCITHVSDLLTKVILFVLIAPSLPQPYMMHVVRKLQMDVRLRGAYFS